MHVYSRCLECDEEIDSLEDVTECTECGGNLEDIFTMECLECDAEFEGSLNEECPECGSNSTEEQ